MSTLALLATATAAAALNLPLGRLRAHAPRRSHRWFGLLAASVFLFLALRHAFALDWITALPLAAVITIGIGTATSEIIREITSLRLRMSFLLA